MNDGGGDFPHKAVSKELFLEVLEGPRQRRAAHPRGHLRFAHHRPAGHARADHPARPALVPLAAESSPTSAARRARNATCPIPIPAKTMLGATQWAWLAGELRKPAEMRLMVSSTQVLAEGHGWERWGNIPLERQKLFDTIRDSGAKGVVLLSGDRHIGALYRETPPGLHPLSRADIERPQHGLLRGRQGARPESRWARSTRRRISASSTSTGGNTRSRWRCATKAATRGDPAISASMNCGLAK